MPPGLPFAKRGDLLHNVDAARVFVSCSITRSLRICWFQLLIWACAGLIVLEKAPAQVARPIPVPGRIEAEDYDTNGPGISYYDTTPGNSGAAYRNDDVDIEPKIGRASCRERV